MQVDFSRGWHALRAGPNERIDPAGHHGPHPRLHVNVCWVCRGSPDVAVGGQVGAQVVGGVSLCVAGAKV